MSAIQATSAGVRDMADGSLRITLEFDPRYAKEAYALFGARGTSCAVAALTQAASKQAAQRETMQSEKPGQLCVMACTFCADPMFWEFAQERFHSLCENEVDAKNFIIDACVIKSRKELDTNQEASRIFLREFREPFLVWRDARRAD